MVKLVYPKNDIHREKFFEIPIEQDGRVALENVSPSVDFNPFHLQQRQSTMGVKKYFISLILADL